MAATPPSWTRWPGSAHRSDALSSSATTSSACSGDAAVTGKPAGDDLREGKLTVLVAKAMAAAQPAATSRLEGLLGRPLTAAEVADARAIIVDSGALAATEAEIRAGAVEATAALDASGITGTARSGLSELVRLATERDA